MKLTLTPYKETELPEIIDTLSDSILTLNDSLSKLTDSIELLIKMIDAKQITTKDNDLK